MNVALQRLQTQLLAPGIERKQLLQEVEAALERPAEVSQGLHPHMCVPAVLESYVAQTQPEDFVKLVAGLASPEGKAVTASGDVLFRIEDALEDDGTDRNLVDRLVQGAIYAGAERAMGMGRTYSSLHHTLDEEPAQGLNTMQTAHMLKVLTGDESWQRNRPSLYTLKQALEHGPIPVVLGTGGRNGHQVLLESMDDESARLRDPEGAYATAFAGAQLDEDGIMTMPTERLSQLMGQAYLKANWLPFEERDPSSWILG